MRTTLTFEDDVARLLEQLRAERKQSLKKIVNEALRLGLIQLAGSREPRRKFRTRAVSLGQCRLPNIDHVAEALAVAEGDDFQ